MKLRWRDELRVALCPERVLAVRYRRGNGNRVADTSHIIIASDAGAPRWKAAIAGLHRVLASPLAHAADLSVVLSSHFVRYAVLPWTAALRGEAEWLKYARHVLFTTYRQPALSWNVGMCGTGFRKPRIACGVEAELVTAIAGVASERGMRLISLQPYLVSSFNRLHGRLRERKSWLALLEGSRLTLCAFDGERWSGIHSRASNGRWDETLRQLVAGAGQLGGVAPPTSIALCGDQPIEPSRLGQIELADMTVPRGAPPALQPFALALA